MVFTSQSIYNKAATKPAAPRTSPIEVTRPDAELPAAVVAAAAAAEVSDPSELVWDSLTILTEVPLFMHISASGFGAEAEKVMSAHYFSH